MGATPMKGCHELEPIEWVDNVITRSCPAQYFSKYNRAFKAYNRWKNKNTLPRAGGWEDQPQDLMEMIDIIEALDV